MLKSKTVANLIETTLNENNKDEKFRVVYEAGSHKGAEINCIFKQGKGTIRPIANYTNVMTPFNLQIVMPMQCGEDRVDGVVDIVNDLINNLNGKVKDIDGGRAVFLFNPLEMGELETRATVGQSILIKLDFNVEYSTNTGTKYEMALINNVFDYGTVNTRYFETREAQIEWYDAKIKEQGTEYSEVLTPNINSLVITQQRYLNIENNDIGQLLNKNYAIIKETKGTETKYYYYYVTGSNIDQYNLPIFDLSMDTIQTHYIDLKFGDCFISKADINRWVEVDSNTVKFDTSVNSELFERESIKDCTKRLVSRKVLGVNTVLYDSANEWLDANVVGWYYIFLSSNALIKTSSNKGEIKLKPLAYANKSTEESSFNIQTSSSLYNTMVCVAFPVMKNGKRMYFAEVVDTENEDGTKTRVINSPRLRIDGDAIKIFLKNVGTSYIYSMKFSVLPPFQYVGSTTVDDITWKEADPKNSNALVINCSKFETYYTDDSGNKITYEAYKPRYRDYGWEIEGIQTHGTTTQDYGLLNFLIQTNINSRIWYDLDDINFEFKKSQIIGANHNIAFNPKLLSSDYAGLVLSDHLQNGAEYDILKLGKNSLSIDYTEAITPDISKRYIRFSDCDGYYAPGTDQNLTGYVVSDDASFALESEQYQSMLANNKNFFIQNALNRGVDNVRNIGIGGFQTLTNVGTSLIAGGSVVGAVASGIGYAFSAINSRTNTATNETIENLMVDNLKNAPNSISGARGNVIFNAMYSDMGVVVERHEILPNEKIIVDDNIKMFGMTLNKIKNIKQYDNIRRYHNYIKANVETIVGNISNPIKDDIRQRFEVGVRFWNVDEIDYSKENYERWLES